MELVNTCRCYSSKKTINIIRLRTPERINNMLLPDSSRFFVPKSLTSVKLAKDSKL